MFRDQIAALLVVDLLPAMDGGSADSPGVGLANDGRQYVLKVATPGNPLLPATEAFCSGLATACQLPVAQGAWLQFPDGTECYGSRLEGGIIKSFADAGIFKRTPLVMNAIKRRWERCDNKQSASGHYALDLFLFNFDRHLKNFIFQEMGTRAEVVGIDYSRAWWTVSGDINKLPNPVDMLTLSPDIERTVAAGRIVRKWIGFDLSYALRTLQILRSVPNSWIEGICAQMPSNWLPKPIASALVVWWNSPSRTDRITEIEEGLKNGSLL